MLMMGNKKKLTETLIGKMKSNADFVQKIGDKSKPMEKNTEVDDDSSAGLYAAAQDLISAISSKDEKAVHRALKNHYEMCKSGDDGNAASEYETKED